MKQFYSVAKNINYGAKFAVIENKYFVRQTACLRKAGLAPSASS